MTSAQEQVDSLEPLQRLGVEVVSESPNSMRVRMPLAHNTNHFGAMYAGVIFTLAEFPFGAMFVSRIPLSEMVPVVGELTIRFLATVTSDLYVTVEVSDAEWDQIRSEVAEHGKSKIVRTLELTDEDGGVKAIATATYFALPGMS